MPDIAVILLAAGHSRRFGATNKLLADFKGKPLISAITQTLTTLPFRSRIAAIGADIDRELLQGFETVELVDEVSLQSDSLKLAMEAALQQGPHAILICLADVPLVPIVHFEQIIAKWSGNTTLVATRAPGRLMPPALFGADWFPDLLALVGDQGARDLIRQATETVSLEDRYAIDVDTINDLEQLRREQI